MSVSLWSHRNKRDGWACGLLYNEHALWIGVHYSAYNRRYCINVLPFLTFWYSRAGGKEPCPG